MMWRGIGVALATMLFAASPAAAHGGGGGGSHGGGARYQYITVIMTGGAVPVPAAQIGDYSHIRNVAIITAIGGGLTLHDSLIWSGPDQPPVNISGWGVDAQVENELTRLLGNRFTIKHADYDRAEIEALENGKGAIDPLARLRDKLRVIANDGIDAFIVVRPDVEGAMMGPPGLGVENRSDMRPVAWANYEIDIIDAHTLTVIGHAASRLQTRSGGPVGFPGRYRIGGFVVDGKQTPSTAQLAQMQTSFSSLISATLLSTLRALALGVTLPDPSERDLIPIPLAMKPFAKVKNVAVISAIGNGLDLNHRGKFFEHNLTLTPIPDWNLDSEIEVQIATMLDKQFSVKTVPVDRAALAKISPPANSASFAPPTHGLTPTQDVDLYILVLKHTTTWMGLDDLSGVGMWNQTPFGDEVTRVFADYTLAVVDAHTLRPILVRTGVMSPHWPQPQPIRTIDNSAFPKDWKTLSDDQAMTVHKAIMDMMTDSLGETLLHMSLTGQMVAPPPDLIASTAPAAPAAATPATAPVPAAMPSPASAPSQKPAQ
jgi:hypothetical protein